MTFPLRSLCSLNNHILSQKQTSAYSNETLFYQHWINLLACIGKRCPGLHTVNFYTQNIMYNVRISITLFLFPVPFSLVSCTISLVYLSLCFMCFCVWGEIKQLHYHNFMDIFHQNTSVRCLFQTYEPFSSYSPLTGNRPMEIRNRNIFIVFD